MRLQSLDTPADVEELLVEGYRRMTGQQRLYKALDMREAVLALAAARIRQRYGADIGERELRLRLASLWIDRETMIKAFGWDPEVQGY